MREEFLQENNRRIYPDITREEKSISDSSAQQIEEEEMKEVDTYSKFGRIKMTTGEYHQRVDSICYFRDSLVASFDDLEDFGTLVCFRFY